jgi:hypothetical protein
MRRHWLVLILFVSCGGKGQAPAKAPGAASDAATEESAAEAKVNPEASAEDAEESVATMPKQCAKPGADKCLPSSAFVTKLCQGNFPSVALVMFQKSMPWTRGYLTRKTRAWNASGGASDAGELAFDEEVLVLRHRSSDMGGMQVSGAGGGYDAIRWNGSCVTLAAEELTLKLPPKAKNSKVEWRFLDDNAQEALRNDPKVDAAYKERRNECKGATMGTVTLKCEKADAKLSDTIVQYVRGGGTLPDPEKLP